MKTAEFDFSDLKPILIEGIKIPDPDTGEVGDYVLKEPSEAAASEYANISQRAYVWDESQQKRVCTGFAEAEAFLVSACLFKVMPNGKVAESVDLEFVKALSPKIVRPLHAKCEEIGGLGQPLTVEDVDERIANLQKYRAKIVARKRLIEGNGHVEKNQPSPATPAT